VLMQDGSGEQLSHWADVGSGQRIRKAIKANDFAMDWRLDLVKSIAVQFGSNIIPITYSNEE
jgi:hypothetical protein